MRSWQTKTTASVLAVMLLSVTTNCSATGDCEMGGFKAGRFGDYNDLGVISNGQWVEDDQEMRQAGNCVWDFCAARRLNGAGIAKSADYGTEGREWNFSGYGVVKILELPLSEVAFGASRMVRVHVRLTRDADHPIYVQADVAGGGSARQVMAASPGTEELVSLNIDVPEHRGSSFRNNLSLSIYLISWTSEETEVVVYSISAFEPQHLPLQLAYFQDTTATDNTIGADDWPVSAFSRKLLRDQQEIIHWARAAKPNLITQCFNGGTKYLASPYASDYADLGRWVIRKPYGPTSITFVAHVNNGPADSEIRASIWSLAKIDYDNETSGFTVGDILESVTSGGRARIVKVVDSGTTGSLLLSYVTGSFNNNDTIRGRNPVDGMIRGGALQNGAIADGDEVDNDVESVASSFYGFKYLSLDTIANDAEYELRLDAEDDSAGVPEWIKTIVVFAHADDGSTIDYKLPRSSWHEQDDPIRSNAYKAIKDTQNATWHNQRPILMSDFRSDVWSEKQKGWDTIDTIYLSRYNLAAGVLYKAKGTRSIKARLLISKGDSAPKRKILFSSGSGSWISGDILIGGTSGAFALVEYIESGTDGYVYLTGMSGAFVDGEALSTLGGWNGTAESPPTPYTGTQTLRLALVHTEGEAIAQAQFDMSLLGRDGAHQFEINLPIDTDQFDNDSSVIGDYPLMWILQAWTTEPGDPLVLEQYQVFQCPMPTLEAELHEDQQ